MFQRTGPLSAVLAVALVVGALLGGTAVVAAQDDSVSLDTEDDTVTVRPAENATIRGTTDLEPGTTLSVRVRSSGDTEPRFLMTSETTVNDDGSFAAAFDFSEIPTNATFTVTVVDESGPVAEREGVVAEQSTTTTTATSSSTVPGFGVTVAVVSLVALAAGAMLVGRR